MALIYNLKMSASEERLEKLIYERLKPDADKKQIDERIWDLFGETWSIMFTDLSGFSRLSAKFGIIHFLQIVYESQRIFSPVIDKYDGILLKVEGDSMMIIFKKPDKAVDCALEMQKACLEYNKTKSDEEQILLCVGIGYGRMLRIGDSDIFGAEVNASSKLGEDTADAWEILVTQSTKDSLSTYDETDFEKIDEIPPGASAAYKLKYSLDD